MVEVEIEFCKSISDLISTVITEGAKVPGGHGVALMSNIIQYLAVTKFALEPSTHSLTYHWRKSARSSWGIC